MKKLQFDLIDKMLDTYVVRYNSGVGSDHNAIFISSDIYKAYKASPIEYSFDVYIPVFNKRTEVMATITKVTNTRKMINNTSMKIEFEDNILYVPDLSLIHI